MKVLGIDTILHNTCASVIDGGQKVISNVAEKHKFESNRLYDLTLAHLRCIGKIVSKAINRAGIKKFEEIELIAVNNFGSQASSTLIGMSVAESLAKLFKIPIVGVLHQEAHFFSCWLERKPEDFNFPIIVLSSSGGHSAIGLIKKNNFEFKAILEIDGMNKKGRNLPNFRGIGAVYGFVAYALGVGDQIGSAPALSKAAERGNPFRFDLFFRRPGKDGILDFSFLEKKIFSFLRQQKKKGKFDKKFINDFAASFEHTISELLLGDLIGIAKKYRAKEIHLVGGISANRLLREKLPVFAEKIKAVGRFPVKPEYCTDNAAMIASLGYYRYMQNPQKYSKSKINLISNFKLEKMAIEQILSLRGKDNFYCL
jgi:N6-L-threonylcarbamoyladenine synthase